MRDDRPEILYEDTALFVCRKPAGMAVQTSAVNRQDMVSFLKNTRAESGGEPYIGLIHRLDQPVEGVMVFAKTSRDAALLSAQVKNRQMDKQYLAVVCGIPDPAQGTLCDFLLRDGRRNVSAVTPADTPGAKEARLSYEVLRSDTTEGRALVRIRLHTGRHHQIRVQFAHAGWPIYADGKYGGATKSGEYCPLALCSCRIGFVHPRTGKGMIFEIRPQGKGFHACFPDF